ncbi:hypothetical protein [Allofranklinella schreckenbergeri]|uniref:hypothetical protein n=1 Tax=Allofranklinella schreckenbergeri TaxID=1076744 RepID=UPI001EED949F|nr:hypothetical protein [Allofranklinella schreckenbergeri]
MVEIERHAIGGLLHFFGGEMTPKPQESLVIREGPDESAVQANAGIGADGNIRPQFDVFEILQILPLRSACFNMLPQ